MSSLLADIRQIAVGSAPTGALAQSVSSQQTVPRIVVSFVADEFASAEFVRSPLTNIVSEATSSLTFLYVVNDARFTDALPANAISGSCSDIRSRLQKDDAAGSFVVRGVDADCVSSVIQSIGQKSYVALFSANRASRTIRTTFAVATENIARANLFQVQAPSQSTDAPTTVPYDIDGNLGVQYITGSILAGLLTGISGVLIIACVASCFMSMETPATFSKANLALGKEF